MSITQHELTLAFKKQDGFYLKKIHTYLNEIYHHIIFGNKSSLLSEANDWATFKNVENTWLTHEINDCDNRYDCNLSITSADDVKQVLKNHPVYEHALFSYLERHSSFEEIKQYLFRESILNIEFFEYLVLAMPGSPDKTRKEIMIHLWDECGRGRLHHFHTNQFRSCLKSFGLQYDRNQIVKQLSWETLAGMNYFGALSHLATHKMKYYGFLAATELLDPPHYARLIRGINRIQGAYPLNIKYYLEHDYMARKYDSSWINKIILPMLIKTPEAVSDFWLGFYLRLDSAQRYYDDSFQLLSKQQAA